MTNPDSSDRTDGAPGRAGVEGPSRPPLALETTLELVGDAAFVVDATGRIVYANDRCDELAETDPASLVGSDAERWLSPEAVERVEAALDLGERGVDEFEWEPSAAGEATAAARAAAVDLRDGSRGCVVVLENDAGSSARERDLERRNERLDQFAGLFAHEIRSPLAVARGRLELARERDDPEELAAADDALARIAELSEDMLWLTRQGRDIGETTPVSVRDVAGDAWRMADAGADATLRVADGWQDARVVADRSRFQQLLENAFSNAVVHGGDGVTVTVGRLDDGLYVEDDGPGIPPEARNDVFDLGYSSTAGGTGLGLAIVEAIAEAHGWEVAAAEADADGARFEITGVDRPE